MALFQKKEPVGRRPGTVPTTPTKIFCRICNAQREIVDCWLRTEAVTTCRGCGTVLENVAALYRRRQPACSACEEPLAQPGFEYGRCQKCGSKYELVSGTPPTLLPSRAQRAAMDRHGKVPNVEE